MIYNGPYLRGVTAKPVKCLSGNSLIVAKFVRLGIYRFIVQIKRHN